MDLRTERELPGVYDGEWTGSGDILESVCPTTGEVLARVKSVCILLYELVSLSAILNAYCMTLRLLLLRSSVPLRDQERRTRL